MTTCAVCGLPFATAAEVSSGAIPVAGRCYARTSEAELRHADAALLARARALPPGLLEAVEANVAAFAHVAALLASGRPGAGSGPDGAQTAHDHLMALIRHADACDGPQGELMTDADSGRPHAAHAAARGILAITRAGR